MMAKDKKLTGHERGQIEAFSKTTMISCTIVIKIERSKTVVNNCLRLKENYGKKSTEKMPKSLSSHGERIVCKLAFTRKYSTRKLIHRTGFNIFQKMMCYTTRRFGRYIYAAKLPKSHFLQ